MKTTYSILCLVLLLLTSSCKKYDLDGKEIIYKELYKTNWLLGDWEKKDSIGLLTESWTIENDSTLVGSSYFIIKKDTVHSETMELIEDTEHLIYTATIIGENNDEAVPFQMTDSKDSVLVFTNPKHDFPQKITYKLRKDKTLLATISGTIKGKQTSKTYVFSKK